MAGRRAQRRTVESDRRDSYPYRYGTHSWVPIVDSDWSRGMVRDLPSSQIPEGGAYKIQDLLVHQPGVLIGRGATAYAGPAMTSATYAAGVAYAEYPAGAKLVGVGDNGHIYTITSGTTTDVGGSTVAGGILDRPKLRVGGSKNLLVLPCGDGTTAPRKYDGSAAPAALGGTPPAGKFCEVYKSRVALAGKSGNENRVYFSPTPDIESTWDTANSWIDFDRPVTGMAALQNALLVFSLGHTERLIGSTPPPGTDMDRQPVGDIGCCDARSIAIYENNAVFANTRGVYMTNGVGFTSLTAKKDGTGIEQFWQDMFQSYNPATWIISGGVFRNFYYVSVRTNAGLQTTLLCYLPRQAWVTLTNISPTMFAPVVGAQDELYYADRSTNRIVKLSATIWSSISGLGGVADANGSGPTYFLQTRGLGDGPWMKAFGDIHVTADLTGNATFPTFDVEYSKGDPPASFVTCAESPFTSVDIFAEPRTQRLRFSTGVDAENISVELFQSPAVLSINTIIRSIEVDSREYPRGSGGPYGP